jgi:hypothetical protein
MSDPTPQDEPEVDLDEFEEAVRRVLTHDEADPEDD